MRQTCKPKQPKVGKPSKGRPAKAIPFIAVVGERGSRARAGFDRNADLALANSDCNPELRTQIMRYRADPIGEHLKDLAIRERIYDELLDNAVHHTSVGKENLARHTQEQSRKADAKALEAVSAWRNDPVRHDRLSNLSLVEVIERYLKQRVKPPRRQADRLRIMLSDGRVK